ncbi:MAG: trans-2-enoyl-CoA reductase family protein [Candidatus Omnitrophica bacterium]|nr:trans-2-enoyl-CoA reductase family protein [Candidatus Omnitrophota bacterium]
MIIEPKIRGFICTTAHPVGCAWSVQEQIDYVCQHGKIAGGPRKVLVVGASTGYGLASRVVAAFGCGAGTIGVFFEKEAEPRRTASAGWYNAVAFERKAQQAGLYARSFNGDAFSDEIKQKVVEAIRKDLGQVDLILYSLASPRRQHPRTGQISKSVLKPIGNIYTGRSLDVTTDTLEPVTLPAATPDEIEQTVSVMGGEDWEYWIDALEKENLLAPGVRTVAYSYVGPEITRSIYRDGTIGKAKDHLEATARKLDERLRKYGGGRALVSVNKALVTQSSSAIPVIPLYFVLLNKVMKEKRVYEDCIAQIYRLFATRLYAGGPIPVDDKGLVRMDDLEMREDVQSAVCRNWEKLNDRNLAQIADLKGYHEEFLKLFGFGVNGVNYNVDVDPDQKLLSASS